MNKKRTQKVGEPLYLTNVSKTYTPQHALVLGKENKVERVDVTNVITVPNRDLVTAKAVLDYLQGDTFISVLIDGGGLEGFEGVTVHEEGVKVATEQGINLIAGTNINLTVTDNPGNDRVDITINATGAASNNYVDGMTFSTVSGDLTLTRAGLGDIVENLDGRYEKLLGNPGTTGYVLSSTTGGVRSWVPSNAGLSTLSSGVGLVGSDYDGTSNETWSLDLNELTKSTSDGDGDYFAVVDIGGSQKLIQKGSVNLSGFNNDLTIDNYNNWNLKSDDANTVIVFSDGDVFIKGGTDIATRITAGELFVDYTGTPVDTNYYATGSGWNTGTGVLTIIMSGTTNVTADLDGRYELIGTNDNYNNWNLKSDDVNTVIVFSDGDVKIVGGTDITTSIVGGELVVDYTGTPVDTNNYVNGMAWNTGTGVLTLTREGLSNLTIDIDDRYELIGTNDNYGSWNLKSDDANTVIVFSDGDAIIKGGTDITTRITAGELFIDYVGGDSNYYVDGLSFVSGTGILTASRFGLSDLDVNIDGRYELIGTNDSYNNWNLKSDDVNTVVVFSNGDVTIAGGTDITTSIAGGILTIDYVGSDANNYADSLAFSTGTGILTLGRLGLADLTVDLDGKYEEIGTNDNYNSWNLKSDDANTVVVFSGGDAVINGGTNVTTRISAGALIIDAANTNNYANSLSFNTTDGILTLGRQGLASLSEDLDGRYQLLGTYDNYVSWTATSDDANNIVVLAGGSVAFEGGADIQTSIVGGVVSIAYTGSETNNYVNGMAWNTGTGELSLTRLGLSTLVIDLDGRYAQGTFDNYGSWTISDGTLSEAIASGNTLIIEGRNAITATYEASNNTLSIDHTDTSTQVSVNNSGRTYIQDITIDAYGHITGLTSATETVVNTNNYADSLAFATGTGVLTIGRSGLSSLTTNLDGRYEIAGTNDDYDYWYISDGISPSKINSTDVLEITGGTNITTSLVGQILTITNDLVDHYVDGLSWNSGTGVLTATRNGGFGDLTVDLDNRYLLQGTYDNYGSWTASSDDANNIVVLSGGGVTFAGGSDITTSIAGGVVTIDYTGVFTNNYADSLDFATGTGVLTLGRFGLSDLTVDLDGRYAQGTFDNYISWTATSDDANNIIVLAGGSVQFAGGAAIETSIAGGVVTIDHTDTSTQASVNNSGRTYIQDITLDAYGHITSIASATETVVNANNYANSLAFSIGNGILTVGRLGLSDLTVDLDGRYLLTGAYDNYANWIISDGTLSEAIGSGDTLIIDGRNAITTTYEASNNTLSIDHSDTSSQASINNSGRTYIQDITLDAYGHITSIASATETVTDTTYTFSNGLTESAGVVKWGGTLIDATTTIDGDGKHLWMTDIGEFKITTQLNRSILLYAGWGGGTGDAAGIVLQTPGTLGITLDHSNSSSGNIDINSETYVKISAIGTQYSTPNILMEGYIQLIELPTPTWEAFTDQGFIYAKGGKIYYRNDHAVEYDLTASGGAGTMDDWTAAADTGSVVISDAETLTFTGGTDITTSVAGNVVTIDYTGSGGPDTNDYVDGVTWNTGSGVLTLQRTGILADLAIDLDGRYSVSDTNYYAYGTGWNTSTGVLTILMSGSSDVTVDLDGRYLVGSTASNSSLLDNLDSSEFLRSNATDYKTSGSLVMNDNIHLVFGNSGDPKMEIFHDGSSTNYIDLHDDASLTIRDANSSYASRFRFLPANGAFESASNITGYTSAFSDIRLKKRVHTIDPEQGLAAVMNLRGIEYHHKYDNPERMHGGYAAHEVEATLPHLVQSTTKLTAEEWGYDRDELFKSVNYTEIIPYITAGMQGLLNRIEQQDKEIKQLKENNNGSDNN